MLALTLALVTAAGPSFIEDDYARALKTAKAKKKLLVVDAWAPWCHTCIFMREHVLNTPAFEAFEKDVVFAAIDTEKPGSAAFLEKFPVTTWPTFFFIDPATESVRFRWAGGADATQMTGLLEAARNKTNASAEADALHARGDAATAVERYLAARKAPNATSREAVSLMTALWDAEKYALCAQTAIDEAPGLAFAPDKASVVSWGMSCAAMLPAGPEHDAVQPKLVELTQATMKLEGLFSDDVSGMYGQLVDERRAAKDDAAVRTLGAAWWSYLSEVSAKATTPAARAVFDAHRVQAAIAAGHAEQMLEPLQRSEKDFPRDYNPPARLALLYRELKRWPEAIAASDRALAKCVGPRKLGLFQTRASLFERQGDVAKQRAALEAAVAYAATLPKAQRPEKYVAQLKGQAAALAK